MQVRQILKLDVRNWLRTVLTFYIPEGDQVSSVMAGMALSTPMASRRLH